jgi:titin
MNTCDSGAGSLRQAILDANANPGADTIAFNIPASDPGHVYYKDNNGAGISLANVTPTAATDDSAISDIDPDYAHSWWSIQLATPLPPITDATTIDGCSQPGTSANTQDWGDNATLRIEINGNGMSGFNLLGATIQGLVINRFGGSGITTPNGGTNVIKGNFIGTDVSGTQALGNSADGITVSASGNFLNNTIGGTTPAARNLIAGNVGTDVNVSGNGFLPGSTLVAGNFIGSDRTGTVVVSDNYRALFVFNAPGTQIGEGVPGGGNLIVGISAQRNVYIYQSSDTILQGNRFGTDATGTISLGQGTDIQVSFSQNLLIGTDGHGSNDTAERNIFAADLTLGPGANQNVVAGNYIGIDATGNNRFSGAFGVGIFSDSLFASDCNWIGVNPVHSARSDHDRNVIGGAVTIRDGGAGADHNVVAGNYIGINASGTTGLAPNGTDVVIFGGSCNLIGAEGKNIADDVLERNVIGGIGANGISIQSPNNVVAGNYVGTDATGMYVLPNPDRVGISAGSFNRIGTSGNEADNAGERNVIAGYGDGIELGDSNTLVAGNFVGTDACGMNKLPNGRYGVYVFSGTNNTIGGVTADMRNVISGNRSAGMLIYIGATGNVVQGNYIGTNAAGTGALPNGWDGVHISSAASGNTIGGTASGAGNIIAFNTGAGVGVVDATSTGNLIRGNSIHDNGGLGIDLGDDGVTLNDSVGHSGPNNFQNFPALTSASSASGSLVITGTLNSIPGTSFAIDFYSNASLDPSGHGQGEQYLGSVLVSTDPMTGAVSFMSPSFASDLTRPYITATATNNSSGDTSEFSLDTIQLNSDDQTNSTRLQSLIATLPASTAPNTLIFAANNVTDANNVVNAVNGLMPVSNPVNIVLNLASGTYQEVTAAPKAGVTLIITGNGSPVTIVGQSPALTVTGGNVIVKNVTLTTATDAPTILVTSGNLTLRNDTIRETTGGTEEAISVAGGAVDLGTAASAGGNTLVVNGTGQFVLNSTSGSVPAAGNSYVVNGTTLPASLLSYTTPAASVNPSVLGQAVTLTAMVRAIAPASGSPSGSVDFLDLTTNTDLGTRNLSGGAALLTTSNLALGDHMIRATYSGDNSFTLSLGSFVQHVQYAFSGFLSPVSLNRAFKQGSSVPIKWRLTDASGHTISSLSVVLSLTVSIGSSTYTLYNGSTNTSSYASDGTVFRNDGSQYVFNWSTMGFPTGSYSLTASFNDGTSQSKTVVLSTSGGNLSLVIDGTGSTAAAAGALLAGDLTLYVNNGNGEFTSDEQARILDAVAGIETLISPYGTNIKVVDSSVGDAANIVLEMTSASAVGGQADGVLGCTTDSGLVTIIDGWNWYAGANAADVGTQQFDFQTVVTHEIGHALGLGHSTSSTSVMYPNLGTNESRRGMIVGDLNVPDLDKGPCGLHVGRDIRLPVAPRPNGVTVNHSNAAAGPNYILNYTAAGKTPAMRPTAVDDFFTSQSSAARATSILAPRLRVLSPQDDPWASPF